MKTMRSRERPITYGCHIGANGRVVFPPSLSNGFRLGQRVYFHAAAGEVTFLTRPTRTIKGRLLSSRIRRGPVLWRHRQLDSLRMS